MKGGNGIYTSQLYTFNTYTETSQLYTLHVISTCVRSENRAQTKIMSDSGDVKPDVKPAANVAPAITICVKDQVNYSSVSMSSAKGGY